VRACMRVCVCAFYTYLYIYFAFVFLNHSKGDACNTVGSIQSQTGKLWL